MYYELTPEIKEEFMKYLAEYFKPEESTSEEYEEPKKIIKKQHKKWKLEFYLTIWISSK